jgi:hypothetical protein
LKAKTKPIQTIGRIVVDKMGLQQVAFKTTTAAGGRAWPGDVRCMQLDVSKIMKEGSKNKFGSEHAIQLATEQLISITWLLRTKSERRMLTRTYLSRADREDTRQTWLEQGSWPS